MIQLSLMVMILGAVVLMALPMPRHRIAWMASKGFGVGVLGAGVLCLVYTAALPGS